MQYTIQKTPIPLPPNPYLLHIPRRIDPWLFTSVYIIQNKKKSEKKKKNQIHVPKKRNNYDFSQIPKKENTAYARLLKMASTISPDLVARTESKLSLSYNKS